MNFPIYRKYPNNKHFFKIKSTTSFEEVSVIGSLYQLHNFNAQIYPDRVKIMDMINNSEQLYHELSESDYNSVRAKADAIG